MKMSSSISNSSITRFIRKFTLYLLAAFLLLNIIGLLFMYFPKIGVLFSGKDWLKIQMRIRASESIIEQDTIYVGDSVAGQLYKFSYKLINDTPNHLTTNGSVYPAGNYILIYNALKNNPQITTVVYASIPITLGNKFERSRTFPQFIKPFFSFDNLEHFDAELIAKMKKRPFSLLFILPMMKIMPISDLDFDDGLERDEMVFTDFSLKWLSKIKDLCDQENVELLLVSPPLREDLRVQSVDWSKVRDQVRGEVVLRNWTGL